MNKLIYTILAGALLFATLPAFAGNPDRQGEAGAPELLMNPWAPSAGLHTMTTSMISGVEAIRLNPAGVARINKTQVMFGHAIYLDGTDINMNAFGLAQRVGNSGAFGISIMSLDFGDIPVTTTNQPEGTGATFSPRFFNIGISYSYIFENKVSVGATVRAVSEAIDNASASAVALDAGVQYVTGERDNFKFGISLRNVGSRMKFGGEGLSTVRSVPIGSVSYNLTVENRPASFELQSVLNIGGSYDFYAGDLRFTLVGNYTSNAFSRDQIGGGAEVSYNEYVSVRAGYRVETGTGEPAVYRGLAAGVTLNVPVSKKENAPRVGIDYAYRDTRIFNGTHNISVRLSL